VRYTYFVEANVAFVSNLAQLKLAKVFNITTIGTQLSENKAGKGLNV